MILRCRCESVELGVFQEREFVKTTNGKATRAVYTRRIKSRK